MKHMELWTESEFFGAIILDDEGPEWTNQCGGTMCAHPVARGHFYPLPIGYLNGSEKVIEDWWHVPGGEEEGIGSDREHAIERVDEFLHTSTLTCLADFDREHAGPFGEAWIPVLFKDDAFMDGHPLRGARAILTYANSD